MERQSWLFDGFNKLSIDIGRAVAGAFSTAKGGDAIRAADNPPTRPALDRRRERLLTAALAAPYDAKRALLCSHHEDGSSRHRIPKWFTVATDHGRLIREGQNIERTTPRP